MKFISIAIILLLIITTTAVLYISQKNTYILQKFKAHIHKPHDHEHHLHINLNTLGNCSIFLKESVVFCGAQMDQNEANITGDIKCIKKYMNEKNCNNFH
ncbi:hypothetical protein ABPG72_008986 [Tetrahymena utriculariae]